jgi:hypothetical protein
MAFDFKLSLTVSSGTARPQGASAVTDWIKKELQGFDDDDDDKKRREDRRKLISSLSSRLWDDLTWAIKKASDEINQTPELRKRIGTLECQDGYTQQILVDKNTIPAVYLTVVRRENEFSVERTFVLQVDGDRVKERETLPLDLTNEDRIFMRKKNGEALLTVDDAVHYLFAPFLHPELLGTKR